MKMGSRAWCDGARGWSRERREGAGPTGRGWRLALALLLLVGLLGGWLPLAGVARAATLTVLNTADDGAGSLRQAIADAAPGDTITFDAALSGQTITLTSGQLQITKDLTITGLGADRLAVRRSDADGTPAFRIFDINFANGATVGPVVTITGLTIANGEATSGSFTSGAGVRLAGGTLTLGESVVTGNRATNYAGVYATVFTLGSALTVRNSTIRGNTATNIVGGLMVGFQATATVVGSTISGNSGIAGYGGVYVQGQGGAAGTDSTIAITNSTISGNTSDLGGGLIVRNNGRATVTNTTISGNSANSYGGVWAALGGNISLTNSTIVNNISRATYSPAQGQQIQNAGTISLRNSIVAGSTTPVPNCNAAVTNDGNNLDDGQSCGFGTANGSRSNLAPALGPLRDNGGPTQTHAPQPGSPAIDAGNPTFCTAALGTTVDQRGVARPQGVRCDIGAVEYLALDRPALTSLSPDNAEVVATDDGGLLLTVGGSGFVEAGISTISFGETALATTYVGPTTLTGVIPAALRATARVVPITVVNAGGGRSNALPFTVENLRPIITAISPASATAGDPAVTVQLTGTRFAPGATVQFDGTTLQPNASPAPTATGLTFTVPAELLADPRAAAVVVLNPGPGGGPSEPVRFTIAAPPAAPAQASVAPSSLAFGERQVGGAASDSQQVILTNGGGSPLAISGVTLAGADPGDFAVTFNTCVGTLPAGASCVVGVRFAPTATGARAASLQIIDSAAGSPRVVMLSGTGTPPPATPVPQVVVFASAQGNGTVSPAGTLSYATGSQATYAATPGAGQLFIGWMLDGQPVGYASTLTFTVDANRTLVARFAARPAFSDVPTGGVAWDAITQLAARGIINGYGDGTFGPGDPVRRAQMAALVVRALGWADETPANPTPFSDLGQEAPDLRRAVAILAGRGIARGYDDGTFDPFGEVGHAQAISLIARSMVQAGYWTQVTAAEDDGTIYPNVPATSDHRLDLLTFVKYAGALPERPTGQAWADWQTSAQRGWIAQVLWQAYSSYFGVDRVP